MPCAESSTHEVVSLNLLCVREVVGSIPGCVISEALRGGGGGRVGRGLLGEAKMLCILRHQGLQLIFAYSWARPAVLVAGKWEMFYFFCFFTFFSPTDICLQLGKACCPCSLVSYNVTG